VTKRTNLAASVAARLLNRAKETGDEHQTLLTSYCLERFLFRLGASDRRASFVLKGAMLLRLWSDQPYRATRDLDLLRRGDGAFEAIREDVRAIVATRVTPDAVSLDADRIRIEAIRAEDEYAGVRCTLPARCGNARLNLQIDMGLGDAVWPPPQACVYPTLLDFPAPDVLAYPREAVVAEKLEAMVVLGERNSRIKDFFDLHHFASEFGFDRATLTEAARHAGSRRRPDRAHAGVLGKSIEARAGTRLRPPGESRGPGESRRRIHATAAGVPCAGARGSADRTTSRWHVVSRRTVDSDTGRADRPAMTTAPPRNIDVNDDSLRQRFGQSTCSMCFNPSGHEFLSAAAYSAAAPCRSR
jgi:hypothetical protein